MSREYSDSEIIKLSLKLLSEEDRLEVTEDATVLLGAVHEWNYNKRFRPMFGEAMAYELLYSLVYQFSLFSRSC